MNQKVNCLGACLILTVSFFLGIILSFKKSRILTPLPISQINQTNLNESSQVYSETKIENKQINILLLGLDARRGDKNPRCDAIHMISIMEKNKTIKIITVPRGTEVPIRDVKNEYTYLSNSCHSYGVDYAVSQIQKITGVKNDYLVKIGFSQTLGALRLINLPSSPALQYLRNRSLPLGDYQRSHNQALFMKDLLVNHFDKLSSLPKSILYLLYKMVDTDMDFDTAYDLYTTISRNQIHKVPNNIILVTKPPVKSNIRDMHFSSAGEKDNWQSDPEFIEYQKNFEEYLVSLINKGDMLMMEGNNTAANNLVKTPFAQRIWEQVENERRYRYYYDILRIFVMSSPTRDKLPSYVLDFITEMEALQEDQWKKKGEELLLTL